MKDYTASSMYVVEPTNIHNDFFQYHNNSKNWEENENNVNQEDLKIDHFNYTSIKKYDMLIKQPPVHRQRKVSFQKNHFFLNKFSIIQLFLDIANGSS